jgi:hypothetical protein
MRLGQIALGVIWLADGLLQLQPYFFHHFVSGVLDPAASGQPAIIGHPLRTIATLVGHQQAAFNALFAVAEVAIGTGLLVRRTVKPALLASFAWALGIWLSGEGLGRIFTGDTPNPATGILNTAPLYLFATALLWPRAPRAGEDGPTLGLLGARGARLVWGVLWVATAALWLAPANYGDDALAGTFSAAPSSAGWLSSLESGAAHLVSGPGGAVTLALAIGSAAIGIGVAWQLGTRLWLYAAMVLSVVFWFVAEGLAGLFTGQATDIGAGPLIVLIASQLLALAPRRQRVRVEPRVAVLAS